MFGKRTTQEGRFRIGILVEIMNTLCSTRIQLLHLGGSDGKRVCGYVHINDGDQMPQVSFPPAIISCTKCLAKVLVACEKDRWEFIMAYQDALDPLSKNEQHCIDGVEFVLLSPVIVPARPVASPFSVAIPPLSQRKLTLIRSDSMKRLT